MLKQIVKTAMVSTLLSGAAYAANVDVKVVNMMGESFFTPLLVSVHPHDTVLFKTGVAASASLQAMAEGGDISSLSIELQNVGAVVSENPAGGLLAPGANTMTTLTSDAQNDSLSITAMILPTNDGFVALNNWKIPTQAGTYVMQINAYDAGTEGNNEIVNGGGAVGVPGIPADPGGHAGTGASGLNTQPEGFVHIHRGVLGDQDPTGGVSDLSSTFHRWLNPVATVIVTVR